MRKVRIDTVHPAVPTLTAVPTPSNNPKPTLSWTSVAGATSYQLTLDGTTISQATTSYTPATNLADGTHTWTVAAVDAATNRSEDAPPQSFVIKTTPPATPTIVAYAPNPTSVASPAVVWSGVTDAASYTVQWDKVATFAGPDFTSALTSSTTWTLPLTTDGTWYWRVQAKDAVNNLSAWSTTGSFTRDTSAPANPALATPAANALVASRTAVLTWATVSDAAFYLVDTSQSATLATYDRQETSFTSRGVTLSADGDWYWRVLAKDAAGNVSAVASAVIRKVTIDTVAPATPVLTTVLSPTNNPSPLLAWAASSGATGYSVTLDGASASVVTTSYTPPSALADGNHTWTVAALDAAGNRSADAPAQSFLVDSTPPAVPTVIAYTPNPTNVASPTVSWSGVAEAASYTVQWDKVATFNGTNLGSATTSSTSYPLPLATDGTWYWRVRSADSVGNASAWSATSSLDRDTAPPASPALVSPAANALSATRTVTLTWSAVAGIGSYLVDLSQSSSMTTYERSETTLTSRTITSPSTATGTGGCSTRTSRGRCRPWPRRPSAS
ncbi:MAG: Ig-like domain-containing protein [Myxococcales bacterium]